MKNKNNKYPREQEEVVFNEFLNDIENDIKLERYKELWKKYGKIVSFTFSVIIAVVLLFSFWQKYQDGQNREAASKFLQAQDQALQGNITESVPKMRYLYKNSNKTYGMLAGLSLASLLLKDGFSKNVDEIIDIYESIGKNTKTVSYFRSFALIMYVNAKLQKLGDKPISEQEGKEWLAILKKCKKEKGKNGLNMLAQEFMGTIYYKQGNFKKARKVFDKICKNPDAAPNMTKRAIVMVQAIQNRDNK